MLKSELIEKLNDIQGDFEVTFPHVEYGGFVSIDSVNIKRVRKISDYGRRKCPETGTDFLESTNMDRKRLEKLYDKKEQNIIVLDW